MTTRTVRNILVIGTLTMALVGCSQDSTPTSAELTQDQPETASSASPSSSSAPASTASSPTEDASPSESASPSSSSRSSAATGGWADPDALPAAEGEPIDTVVIPGPMGGEVTVELDAVEYSTSDDLPGETVAALAFTLTAADQPVELGVPLDGTDWVYATQEDGSDATSFYQMRQDYSESWVGRDVTSWHRGPFAPGRGEQVMMTIPIKEPGGYIAYVTGEGHMVGPIELPAEDTGLPNSQISRAHEIVNSLGWGDSLMERI